MKRALASVTFEVLEELLMLNKNDYKIVGAEVDIRRNIVTFSVTGKEVDEVPEGAVSRYIALDIYKEDSDGNQAGCQ
jgi:hypothetical protein